MLLLVIRIINCSGYVTTYSYEKVHFWHLIPFYQPNQWTDGPGQHSRMIKPGFEVYNPLISYIRQASRKFPKWGLKLCCSQVIQNHPRISVMTFQAYFWVERNYSNFWHLLLIRNNPILSVPSHFSVNDFYFFKFATNSINNNILIILLKHVVSLKMSSEHYFLWKGGWESISNTPTNSFVPPLIFWTSFKVSSSSAAYRVCS